MAAIGSVSPCLPLGWLIKQVRSVEHRDWSTLGLGLALPLIANPYGSNTVDRSSFLWGDGWFDGMLAMKYSRRDAREKRYQGHIKSLSNALFSLGGMPDLR